MKLEQFASITTWAGVHRLNQAAFATSVEHTLFELLARLMQNSRYLLYYIFYQAQSCVATQNWRYAPLKTSTKSK